MVGVVSGSLYRRTQPKSSGLVLGRRPLGAILHSSNEPGELSQWLCYDDSTINIVVLIIIIIDHPHFPLKITNHSFRLASPHLWNQLPVSFHQSTNHSPSHLLHFIHGSSCSKPIFSQFSLHLLVPPQWTAF